MAGGAPRNTLSLSHDLIYPDLLTTSFLDFLTYCFESPS